MVNVQDQAIPRQKLPTFRRVSKPLAQKYDKPESGELPASKQPGSATQASPSTDRKRPVARNRIPGSETDLMASLAGLSLGGKYASAADHIDTSDGAEGKDSKVAGASRGKDPDFAYKLGLLHHSIFHSKPAFKQIVNRKKPSLVQNEEQLANKLMEHEFDGSNVQEDEPMIWDKIGQDSSIPGLVPKLLPHQVVGVKFMVRREHARKYAKGGLLADAMGLGKTVQSIALILHEMPNKKVPRKGGQRSTSIICPLAVMDQWKDEIMHKAPKLTVLKHHGDERVQHSKEFQGYDVVSTTYALVARECERDGPLFDTAWYRLIADEAHVFRNRETKMAVGMMELKCPTRRWALTGTPVHNSLLDLYTLLEYIGQREDRTILKENAEVASQSLTHILKSMMLRRSQRVIQNIMPTLEIVKRGIHLNLEEECVYRALKDSRGGDFSLRDVTSLRLACDGSTPSTRQKDVAKASAELKEDMKLNDNSRQGRDEFLGGSNRTQESPYRHGDEEEDPITAKLAGLSLAPEQSEKVEQSHHTHDNSKIKALKDILNEDRRRKTVVFSQFVILLEDIKAMLDAEGISSSIYYGALTAPKRKCILEKFADKKHNNVTVLLCSLHATAVGSNLVSASRVVVMEPWWNPQIVDQAIKRVHRLGQTRPVKCYELYVSGLIESRIMVIQDRKRALAQEVMGQPQDATLSKEEFNFIINGEDVFSNEVVSPEPKGRIEDSAKDEESSSTSTNEESKPLSHAPKSKEMNAKETFLSADAKSKNSDSKSSKPSSGYPVQHPDSNIFIPKGSQSRRHIKFCE